MVVDVEILHALTELFMIVDVERFPYATLPLSVAVFDTVSAEVDAYEVTAK